jgi:hypothetical protein
MPRPCNNTSRGVFLPPLPGGRECGWERRAGEVRVSRGNGPEVGNQGNGTLISFGSEAVREF